MTKHAKVQSMAENSFMDILRKHKETYPLMEPQDYGKLIYQSVFGPEHMISDSQAVRKYILEEMTQMQGNNSPQVPEDIGNGLCRFPLCACPSIGAVGLLTDLFLLTARENDIQEEVKGKLQEQLKRKLELTKALDIPGMEKWEKDWEKEGYPAIHHSKVFKEAYHPHYRLLRKEYGGFFPVLWEIERLMGQRAGEGRREHKAVVVGIDGRCGSGKTSVARLIAKIYPCNVFHMDDFYLPVEERVENWSSVPGGNMDLNRFRSEVLLPVCKDETVHYRPYHCSDRSYGETVTLQNCNLVIVEGSYSHHPLLDGMYDLKIFLTCSGKVQTKRLQEREKSYYSVFKERWIPMEEHYFRCCNVEENSDLIVDTDNIFQ